MKIVRFRGRLIVGAALVLLLIVAVFHFFDSPDNKIDQHHRQPSVDDHPQTFADQYSLRKRPKLLKNQLLPVREELHDKKGLKADKHSKIKPDSIDRIENAKLGDQNLNDENIDRHAFHEVDPEEPKKTNGSLKSKLLEVGQKSGSQRDRKHRQEMEPVNKDENGVKEYFPVDDLSPQDKHTPGKRRKPSLRAHDSFLPPYLVQHEQPGAAQQQKLLSPKYPILNQEGSFIPSRRIVHLDLKGAPPKAHFFKEFFRYIAQLGATGILIEYEDMFPYTGVLAPLRSTNAYSDQEVKQIIDWAAVNNLEVIPLVQTFGHLEWILKHEKYISYREVERYAQVICPSNSDAVELVKTAIDQIMHFHKFTSEFFHMGADEAFHIGMCSKCQDAIQTKYGGLRDRLMLQHIANISSYVKNTYKKRVLMWHDMLNNVDPAVIKETGVHELVEPVVWAYAESLSEYLFPDLWSRLSSIFPYVWGCSAFKGADGPARFHSNVPHYLRNNEGWVTQMQQYHRSFKEFRGMFFAGWQRFDHFALLCEILPVGIPSLTFNLLTVAYGKFDDHVHNLASRAMQCGDNVLFNYQNHPQEMYVTEGCHFPGSRVYELIQQYYVNQQVMLQSEVYNNYQVQGWLSTYNTRHNFSSAWYLDQIMDKLTFARSHLRMLVSQLRIELAKVFHNATVDEFLFEYVERDTRAVNEMYNSAQRIASISYFPRREFQLSVEEPQGSAPSVAP